jgi:glycogen synthase
MNKRIVFVAYETSYAPCGGVAAVMKYLPIHLKQASGYSTVLITPYHKKISKTKSLEEKLETIGSIDVKYRTKSVQVDILRLEGDIPYYFLKPLTGGFFAGKRHPYDVGKSQAELTRILRRDALFFGAAVSKSLQLLDWNSEWILLLQDWEAATVALALHSLVPDIQAELFITLHNSYDSRAQNRDLIQFGIDPSTCPGKTILNRALPQVEQTVFTVSEQFALDLIGEILHSKILAPHLSPILGTRLRGINNGLFADLTIDRDALSKAEDGDFASLDAWKRLQRSQAFDSLQLQQNSSDFPIWGDISKFDQGNKVIFILGGRDDSRQKGYDLACSAITRFLEHRGKAGFIFLPIPGDEGLPGLSFLKQLSTRFPKNVLVLPFIFQEGYHKFLQGATYGIMPSLYEPFGMANEFYLKGTVGIGRATGGIVEQIVPVRDVPSFSLAAKIRSDHWHSINAKPTGFLFREKDDLPNAVSDWRIFNEAKYDILGGDSNRVTQREHLLLFQDMVSELYLSIRDAVHLFETQPASYYEMLIDGIAYLTDHFSWEKTASAYHRFIA